ncbi:MAG TPA: T9SS type A sorting domain-containing protein [Candidatus Kapabacteria bacterium]|nr:T9SS type A sorting domain-containing protein [Candidatus Kapabacteria bacterium]
MYDRSYFSRYPAGVVQGNGCSVIVTINPICGLHGVQYVGTSSLSQNYPNPFSSTTVIHVTLSQHDVTDGRLKIYNIYGEEVANLTGQLAQQSDITFTAGGIPSGVYYYVLETGSGRWVRQMFLIK